MRRAAVGASKRPQTPGSRIRVGVLQEEALLLVLKHKEKLARWRGQRRVAHSEKSVHSFTLREFIEQLLCVRHCDRWQGHSREQNPHP